MGARGRIKGLGACWVPKGWGGFDCLFPCRAKARRCAEQSEARRKFGEFDPQKCLLEYAADYSFFDKKVYLFIKKTAHLHVQYPLWMNIIALFCPSKQSIPGRNVIISIVGLHCGL